MALKRDARNLLLIITRNCKVESEIVSDEWRAYRKLKKGGFKHYTVNHTKNFVDPKSKKHTQLIECLWDVGKSTITKRSRGLKESKLPGYLAEQQFRSIHTKYGSLIFEGVLNLLKQDTNENVFKKIKQNEIKKFEL